LLRTNYPEIRVSDVLLRAKLIDNTRGTMTAAAPGFAYSMLAKRPRKHAKPAQFDLSTLRWALSGGERVELADVKDLSEAGAPFGAPARRQSCPPTAWPRRLWQCPFPSAAPGW
jgi:acyl-CoA synthetase (AMP-forming)/AMP-acid ligase II